MKSLAYTLMATRLLHSLESSTLRGYESIYIFTFLLIFIIYIYIYKIKISRKVNKPKNYEFSGDISFFIQGRTSSDKKFL